MKIIETAINLRVSVLVMTALISAGGLYAYVALPKESSPSIEIPNIVITTLYPGASPKDVESLITQPIEQEVQGINGIDNIRSTSTEGVSTIVIEFTPDIAIDDATQKVRDKVDLAKPELPEDAEDPIVSEIDLSEFPIMSINLAASYPLSRLKQVAEALQDELEAIASVLEVDLIGGREREVQVNVDLSRLKAYNVTFDDIIKTVSQENTNLPGGSIDVDRQNYLVRVDGEFDDPRVIEDLVIKAPDDTPIYIRDVAEVVFGFKERQSYARLRVLKRETDSGYEQLDQTTYAQVITLNVKKRSGENILDTAEAVEATIARFEFPPGTQTLITGDQSENVEALVLDLENNIISGLIFVVAVLLFFLGVRTSILVGIAIPLSMVTTFIVFLAMGQTLNFIILFSLIIALGMMVDNAIVIVENIYRFIEMGYDRFEAARKGTDEVGMAVVASTATTVAVFVPMMFWPGIIGEFMGFMPLTLIVTLSASLFVALVINPVLTGYFAEPGAEERALHAADDEFHRRGARRRRIAAVLAAIVVGLVLAIANPITLAILTGCTVALVALHLLVFRRMGAYFMSKGLPAVIRGYRRFLRWMLERDYTARAAYWRNATALGSFAAGAVLAVLGGFVAAAFGQQSAMVLLMPAGALALIGLVGIIVHTLESLILGGGKSVLAGLAFGLVMFGVLFLISLAREVDPVTFVELMLMPAIIVACGVIGFLIRLVFKPRRFILTDNRARLLNCTLGGLFAIVGMFFVAPTGVAFFPETDPNQVQVVVEGALGTNIEASNRFAIQATEKLDALLETDPESKAAVENVLVNVGVGGDAMFGGGAASPERSVVSLNLVDFKDRVESSTETLRNLRDQLQGIPGTEIEFKRDQAGPPTGAPVNIEISGPRFEEIVHISSEVKSRLAAAADAGRIQGLVDLRDNLNTGRPELRVDIDRERAGRFGLNTRLIASTIRTAINGAKASTYRTGKDEYDITVRLAEKDRSSLDAVRGLTVLHEGQQIPVVSFADFELGGGLGSITRLDLQRVVTVQGNAASGVNAQALLMSVQQELADYIKQLPPGYTVKYTGESEEQQEAFGFLSTALTIGCALILMILIAQFNSVVLPFIIMLAVGLSMIGVLLGLIITRTPFSLFTFIGVISLAGIVVNNSIVLIDYTQQLRQRGLDKQEAIIEAGATRLRPVLLTAMTTVLGLIPLTFGINIDFVGLFTALEPDFRIGSENTQFWGPMGTTIVAGLTFGTFLTLVIVPVLYSLLDSTVVRVRHAFGLKPPSHLPDADAAAEAGAEGPTLPSPGSA
ncbi:MAG: efflux RND transporter permease subunit [Myxococcales bacterium]|nr:efflux RND transporter permease subunit [Myxococcales bacterium]